MVKNAVSTLESIVVKGKSRADDCKVYTIIAALLVKKANETEETAEAKKAKKSKTARPIGAPVLSKVEVEHSSRSVWGIGLAAVDNLLPALQDLTIARCHANKSHMKGLIQAIGEGHLSKLRRITWDGLAGGEQYVSNLMLEAFSRGNCPEMKFISFIDNTGFDQKELSHLRSGLTACPDLQEIRMDTTMKPYEQLRELNTMIDAGDVPRLKLLEIRIASELSDEGSGLTKEAMDKLSQTASSRVESPLSVLMRFRKATLNSW